MGPLHASTESMATRASGGHLGDGSLGQGRVQEAEQLQGQGRVQRQEGVGETEGLQVVGEAQGRELPAAAATQRRRAKSAPPDFMWPWRRTPGFHFIHDADSSCSTETVSSAWWLSPASTPTGVPKNAPLHRANGANVRFERNLEEHLAGT